MREEIVVCPQFPEVGVWLLLMTVAVLAHGAPAGGTWQRAIRTSDLGTIERLMAAGANVNQATAAGKTALMAAAGKGDYALAARLVAAGASVTARNRNGGTALMYGAVGGNAPVIRLLLKHGASVDAVAANGWSALTLAAVKGHLPVVDLLLSRGADPTVRDVYGWTVLMRAVGANRAAVVRRLLATGKVDVNAADEQGETALHHAVMNANPAMARLLVAAGARVDVRDSRHRTPRTLALESGQTELAAWLAEVAARRKPGTGNRGQTTISPGNCPDCR
jgi:ankyrin repeat protein